MFLGFKFFQTKTLQLLCSTALLKAGLSVILLPMRFKLFSLQLLSLSAAAKCLAALSVNLLFSRFKLFSLQLLSFNAAVKCSAPLSVNLLKCS